MAVTAGSIAFVAFSFDNHSAAENVQGFAFVVLEPIAANERIRFVDGRMAANGALDVDAQVVWTNGGSTLPTGTIVQVTFSDYRGTFSTDAGGYRAAAVNIGTVTAPTGINGGGGNIRWNVDTTDSLYAVTATTGASPGTTVAAVVWGSPNTAGITPGASVFNPAGDPAPGNDMAVVNAATANASYANAAAARAAFTDPANWVADDDSTDGTGSGVEPDWPPLSDANSPLNGKQALTVAAPAFSFGDANGRVNGAEAPATPVTISGLPAGATAVVTFKSGADAAVVTHTFTANGPANVNLSGLADGAITITNVAVTSGGATTNYANPIAGNAVVLDKTPPAAPTIDAVVDDVGSVQGTLANGGATDDTRLALAGTAEAGATIEILNGAAVVGTTTAGSDGKWTATTSALPAGPVSLTARRRTRPATRPAPPPSRRRWTRRRTPTWRWT